MACAEALIVRIEVTYPFAEVGDDLEIKRFLFDPGLRAVRFEALSLPGWFGILHGSTKEPGRWQFSTFDEHGAIGDLIRDTPEQALWDYGIMPDGWATPTEVIYG
jgi:hypothetical protein